MEPSLLQIDRLTGGYGGRPVLKDITFGVRRGEFLGIIGPNGSGKSTLLKLMSRVLDPEEGRVFYGQRDIAALPLKEYCRKAAFVQQETMIPFPFTVAEIALLGRIPHLKRLERESRRDYEIVERSLKLTDALHLKDKKIDQLSGGERQRALIAKALSQEPELLFLDEPTSHLDIGHQIQILDLLKGLCANTSLTLVAILHDLNLAGEYCDRLILLDEGRIYKEGTPAEVLTYQNIEAVYKTVVVVLKNPSTQKPHVVLVPKEAACPARSS